MLTLVSWLKHSLSIYIPRMRLYAYHITVEFASCIWPTCSRLKNIMCPDEEGLGIFCALMKKVQEYPAPLFSNVRHIVCSAPSWEMLHCPLALSRGLLLPYRHELERFLWPHPPGRRIQFRLWRNGTEEHVSRYFCFPVIMTIARQPLSAAR